MFSNFPWPIVFSDKLGWIEKRKTINRASRATLQIPNSMCVTKICIRHSYIIIALEIVHRRRSSLSPRSTERTKNTFVTHVVYHRPDRPLKELYRIILSYIESGAAIRIFLKDGNEMRCVRTCMDKITRPDWMKMFGHYPCWRVIIHVCTQNEKQN